MAERMLPFVKVGWAARGRSCLTAAAASSAVAPPCGCLPPRSPLSFSLSVSASFAAACVRAWACCASAWACAAAVGAVGCLPRPLPFFSRSAAVAVGAAGAYPIAAIRASVVRTTSAACCA
eukprot:6010331-Pleurochrysis_carterae.AAC.1